MEMELSRHLAAVSWRAVHKAGDVILRKPVTCRGTGPVLSLAVLNGYFRKNFRGAYAGHKRRAWTEDAELHWEALCQACALGSFLRYCNSVHHLPRSQHHWVQVSRSHGGSSMVSTILLEVTATWKAVLEEAAHVNQAKAFTWKYYFGKAHFSGNCSWSIHQMWKILLNLCEVTRQ